MLPRQHTTQDGTDPRQVPPSGSPKENAFLTEQSVDLRWGAGRGRDAGHFRNFTFSLFSLYRHLNAT